MSSVSTVISSSAAQFAMDVRAGLGRPGQKELPSKYLYDPVGWTLFEAICQLPEYGLTRADERLLSRYSSEIASLLPGPILVSELGSGSGKKTRYILEALGTSRQFSYYPIEISSTALASCERELGDIGQVKVVGIQAEYLEGLSEVASVRTSGSRLLVLFLGSTIGNFDAGADLRFLQQVRQKLAPGDALLLGADLLKPRQQLIAAYADPVGVTAAFNINLLARINRELDGDFKLSQFEHLAKFNEAKGSIEMHLRSLKAQTVTIPAAELTVRFEAGETIWTESSHKYSRAEIVTLATEAGFHCEAQWIDNEWPFSENLLLAV